MSSSPSMTKAEIQTAAVMADVLMARRQFVDAYWVNGSGWFKDAQTAEDLFDDLAEQGAFTLEWIQQQAARLRKEEGRE